MTTPAPLWFYRSNDGSEVGPLTSSELKKRALRGEVKAETLVRRGEVGNWSIASKVNGLRFDDTALPPTVAAAVPEPPVQFAANVEQATLPSPVPCGPRLYPCPDCGSPVSRRAKACPACGAPRKPVYQIGPGVLFFVAGTVAFLSIPAVFIVPGLVAGIVGTVGMFIAGLFGGLGYKRLRQASE